MGLRRSGRAWLYRTLRRLYWALPLSEERRAALRQAFIRLTGYRISRLAPLGSDPAEVNPGASKPNVEDYYVWAVIDWHFRFQRPQHLAIELARAQRRVFYISSNFIDEAASGFRVEPLDSSGRLFQIFLQVKGAPAIYSGLPNFQTREQLRASLSELLVWTGSQRTVSLVQHPFWFETARALPNGRLVYDCMDYHEGFGAFSEETMGREQALMKSADLVVVSSAWLDENTAPYNPRRALIRNAADYEHFARPPEVVFQDPQGRRVIGYYGAIAGWFDVELVAAVARRFADCLVLLVGHDHSGAARKLGGCPNVRFTGEAPYAELPYYLYGFDVCLLPFRISPLTLATNPVKVYEYLSAGRPVVSVDLPEIRQFGDLVQVAGDREAFVAAVGEALFGPRDSAKIARRQAFAAEQTWAHRGAELMRAIKAIPDPLVRVSVTASNNLEQKSLS